MLILTSYGKVDNNIENNIIEEINEIKQDNQLKDNNTDNLKMIA